MFKIDAPAIERRIADDKRRILAARVALVSLPDSTPLETRDSGSVLSIAAAPRLVTGQRFSAEFTGLYIANGERYRDEPVKLKLGFEMFATVNGISYGGSMQATFQADVYDKGELIGHNMWNAWAEYVRRCDPETRERRWDGEMTDAARSKINHAAEDWLNWLNLDYGAMVARWQLADTLRTLDNAINAAARELDNHKIGRAMG